MSADELREKLAEIEHERWASWQKWIHDQSEGIVNLDGSLGALTIPMALVQRWERQIATPYAELSDAEKASDMEQVDRYWALIQEYAQDAYDRGRESAS